ncbi:unnamed protein product [Macrosiphum euphorbiae]|uniref:Retrotransposon gag domain-containing protein n=1 Tax=Macrosiphum euphorbiae TaxID=13131 RepID=A0AAV0WSS7_9HEMI|nr:unnamed protein product [Macrosiphum euphorbiae]
MEPKISRQRWIKVLATQLKGDAGTWWGRIRAIDPTWEEFHEQVQWTTSLHTGLMGWKQINNPMDNLQGTLCCKKFNYSED